MVFQSFNLFSNMNVLENCMAGPVKVLRRSREEARARALRYLEQVGMAPSSMPGQAALRRPEAAGGHCPRPRPWSRRCSSSTSPPPPWTPRW